jgi:hypothetical protein
MPDNFKLGNAGMILLIAGFLMGSPGPAASGDPQAGENVPEIHTEVDKKEVSFGGRVKLRVFSEEIQGVEMLFPEAPQISGHFTTIVSSELKKRIFGKNPRGREYVLGIYTTGTHVIPPVEVKYRRGPGQKWESLYSRQVPVIVKSLIEEDSEDIKDVKGIVRPESFFLRNLVIGVLLIVPLAAGLLFYIFRKRREALLSRENGPVVPAHEIAYSQLSRLKAMELYKKDKVKEFYTFLSDILRHYLENRFTYRAPEMTTQEFIENMRAFPALAEEEKQLLRNFLTRSDMIKFAQYRSTPLEMVDSLKMVEDFVDRTREVEENNASE